MASKSTKSKATENDRSRRDEAFMEDLGIRHVPLNTPDTWPMHFQKTFNNINNLGKINYQAYDESTPAQHGTVAWRQDIKLRAKKLSDVARRLFKESPSELTWRLELEKLVDARFDMKTECPTCSDYSHSSRLWRSEIEVETERDGPITKNLESRRKIRVPCQCERAAYNGLNPLFSNRADQAFHYEPQLAPSRDINGLTKRRTDRVYGLRQTTNLEERLKKPARDLLDDTNERSVKAVMDMIDSEGDEALVRDLIQSTPFDNFREPLVFPFLVMEAKSEGGRGFIECGIQTSLPIWSLLRNLERLSELGASLNELGGPLIWYIAYRGDQWRISGCCTNIEKGQKQYQIIELWDGRICSPDGALQILLIMDYIFDWSRDLYRPSILRSLEAIATREYDETASLVTDSDIFSSRKNPRLDNTTEVESNYDLDFLETSAAANDESLLDSWRTFDTTKAYGGYSYSSFRPSYVMKSAFKCVTITGDNIGTLIASLGSWPQNHTKMARNALAALRTGPMILTDRILSQIEDKWTGTIRPTRHANISQKKFCSVAYRVTISSSWELTRAISCFAVDESALETIRRHSKLQLKSFRLDGMEDTAPTVDEASVAAILQFLLNRSHVETLSYAVSGLSNIWKPVGLLSTKERKQLGSRMNQAIVLQPEARGDRAIQKIVNETYRRHKQPGLLEPDFPYLRFSARLDSLASYMPVEHQPVFILPPKFSLPKIASNSPILLCNYYHGADHLCVYVTKPLQTPPELTDVFEALATATTTGKQFVLGRFNWNGKASDAVFNVIIRPEEDLLRFRLAAASQRWALKLERKYSDEVTAKAELQASIDAVINHFRSLQPSEIDREETLNSLYLLQPFFIRENDPRSRLGRKEGSRPAKLPRREVVDLTRDSPTVESSTRKGPSGDESGPLIVTPRGVVITSSEMKKIEAEIRMVAGNGITDDLLNKMIEIGYFG